MSYRIEVLIDTHTDGLSFDKPFETLDDVHDKLGHVAADMLESVKYRRRLALDAGDAFGYHMILNDDGCRLSIDNEVVFHALIKEVQPPKPNLPVEDGDLVVVFYQDRRDPSPPELYGVFTDLHEALRSMLVDGGIFYLDPDDLIHNIPATKTATLGKYRYTFKVVGLNVSTVTD